MNAAQLLCPNVECPARGRQGCGNIGVHQAGEQRYLCHACHKAFSATTGALFHGPKTEATTVLLVVTLLAYGCPLAAIVKAFGFDERTVKPWWQRAGTHCEALHAHLVGQAQWDKSKGMTTSNWWRSH